MKTYLISLSLVRMAIAKPFFPDMLCSAQSTSNHHPALNRDGTLIHGKYVVLSTSNSWSI